MDMLLSRARRGTGQSVTRYLYWAGVIAIRSTYRITDADWDAFTTDVDKRDGALRLLAATLAHRADAADDGAQYLLEQLDGRSILTRRGLNAIQSAAYRNAVSLAMAFFLDGSEARHEADRRQLRSRLDTIAVSDPRIPLRPAAVYALVEATRAFEDRKIRETTAAASSRQ